MAKKTKVKGIAGLSKKLKQLGIDVEKGAQQAAVAGALILQNGMKVRAPKQSRNLARSIHVGGINEEGGITNQVGRGVPAPERSKGRIKVYVGTNVEYARIHEFGGTITPKKARYLRFKVKGEWVFAKSVTIPARPYVRPTFDEDGAEAMREVGEAFRDIIRAAVKKSATKK